MADRPTITVRDIAGPETIEKMRQVLVDQVGPGLVKLILAGKPRAAMQMVHDVHAVVRLFDMTPADLAPAEADDTREGTT